MFPKVGLNGSFSNKVNLPKQKNANDLKRGFRFSFLGFVVSYFMITFLAVNHFIILGVLIQFVFQFSIHLYTFFYKNHIFQAQVERS